MKKTILYALFLLFAVIGAQAQSITVKGTVLSATDNEPLIGATVVSKADGTNGVATDFDGNFTLVVPEGSDLTVSYVGFKTGTVKAAPEIKIHLEEDAELLSEVVVVGYSAEKKSDLTGSVTVLK